MKRVLTAALAAALLGGCATAPTDAGKDTAYLFAYFIGNGEDGLHFAASRDGYHWDALGGGRSYLKPTVGKAKLMRDPCIVQGPDGRYHMVWTSGWKENQIGYASSTDLRHWSTQQALPVMAHEATVMNAWAPEVTYDAERGEFVLFWASTVPDKFPDTDGSSEDRYNHRLYATTTRDFKTFTPTRLFYDPGFSVIDATFLTFNGRRHLVVKDETRHPPRKYLQLVAESGVQGPFGQPGAPFTPAGKWVEGPTALQVDGYAVVYYDAYTAKHYGALRSRDLVHWEDVTARMRFPDEGTPRRMRHGTALAVPAALVEALNHNKEIQ